MTLSAVPRRTFTRGSHAPGLRIPFNRPWLSGRELEYVSEALRDGHLSGDGPFTGRCQELLRTSFGHERALLTTSCTDALEMCCLLLELGPGDEVIMPSFSFVSTANAFLLHGATPVFVDIDPVTQNIDPNAIAAKVTKATRAIVVVHYAGVGCEMEEILAIAQAHELALIEDNAHGLGGSYHGRPLGSFGVLSTLSFHETKNFTCGEGGALVINDQRLFERAEVIREKGTDRSKFFRGQVDKYGWVDVGSSYLPSDILAAHLCAQLEAKDVIQGQRARIWGRYQDGLADWAAHCDVLLPRVPADREQAYHMFFMVMPSLDARTHLIESLRELGILAVFHYLPLHASEMGRKLGFREGDCPVTQSTSERLVRLPFFTGLTPDEQDEVISAVRQLA